MRRAILPLFVACALTACSSGGASAPSPTSATGGPSTTSTSTSAAAPGEGSTTSGPGGPSATGSTVPSAPTSAAPTTGAPTTAPPATTPATAPPATPAPSGEVTGGGDRPWSLITPKGYSPSKPAPLLILLHAFTASGEIQDAYFGLAAQAAARGMLYVHPDGTKNIIGQRYWNATDACCGLNSTVDDVAYVNSIIDAVSKARNVDPKRIYLMGHSNGGFMSYRMACDSANRIAAIASLAGATFDDPSKCKPSAPVSVLEVHGTADETIAYAGGVTPVINGRYPGAEKTVATWAGYDKCAAAPSDTGIMLDLEASLPGAETTVRRATGCPPGIGVELWTVNGGMHTPGIVFGGGKRPMIAGMLDFLMAHPKP